MAEVGADLAPEVVVDRSRQSTPGQRADAAEILRGAAVRREQPRSGPIAPGIALRRKLPDLREAAAPAADAGDYEVRVSPGLRARAPGHERARLRRLRPDELPAEHHASGGRGCGNSEGGEECEPDAPEPSPLFVQHGS